MNFLAAALYAVASSVLIALVLGFCAGGLTAMAALIALCGGFVVGTFGWWRSRGAQKLPRPGGWAIAALVLFALISLRAFLWLIFREGDELRVLSPNNLGDMSLHLTFIRYLANGAPFWPDSPIFSAGKLTYSVGMDFFNSLLSLIGVNTERGLIWTGLLGALATGIALLRWGGAFTVLGFLCNGGLAALAYFASGPNPDSASFSVDDFEDLPALASKVKHQSRAVDTWLTGQLSSETKAALARYEGQNGYAVLYSDRMVAMADNEDQIIPEEQKILNRALGSVAEIDKHYRRGIIPHERRLRDALVRDFASLLRGPSVHQAQRFAGVALRWRTQQLLSQAREGLDCTSLNRLLLEDAYPLELRRSHIPLFRDYQAEWAWKSLPLSILVTQRGFLFALPAGLLLLTSWRTRFFQDGKGWSMPFLGELLLYAAMPFFHLHTFLALSFLLAAFLIARPAARLPVTRLIAAAFLPATVLLYLTVGMFKTNAEPMWEDMGQFENPPGRPPADAIGWQPGWMVNDATTADIWQHVADANPSAKRFASHGKFLLFWFGNFGVLPLLLVPFAIALLRPVFPRGPSHRAGWAWFAIIVAITPLLGVWSGYREKSLGALLTGGGEIWDLRAAVVPLLALAAAVAATRLPRMSSRDFGLRQALFATSGVLMLDALFMALHTWNPHIPLLRADATPLLLATYAFIVLLWRMSRQPATGWPALIGLPALFLFFVCCNIRFANWDWDNTKMMLWCWVIVLAALWEALLVRWNPWLRAAIATLLFFSGFLSVLGGIDGSHPKYAIAKLSTLDAVAQAVRDIPITEPFAAQPTFNHPLLLCGRKVVMGYEGHLSSHGIEYGPVNAELDALMRGVPDWRLRAARLGVRYLFFGPGERATWPESNESWRMSATVIAAGEWGEIFDLETPPLPVDESETPKLRLAPRLQPPSPQP